MVITPVFLSILKKLASGWLILYSTRRLFPLSKSVALTPRTNVPTQIKRFFLCEYFTSKLESYFYTNIEGSGDQVVKVSDSYVRGYGFEPYKGSQQWFLIWHQYWLVPGGRMENKNLLYYRAKTNMFKLTKILIIQSRFVISNKRHRNYCNVF